MAAKKSLSELKKTVAKKRAGKPDQGTSNKGGLKPMKEHEFVSALLRNGFNIAGAYGVIHPKSKRKTWAINGARFVNRPAVRAAINKAIEERKERNKLDEDFVLKRWIGLANANPADYTRMTEEEDGSLSVSVVPFHDLEEWQQRNIKKLKVRTRYESGRAEGDPPVKVQEVELELYDYQKAVDTVAKHLGMLEDRGVIEVVDWAEIIRTGMDRVHNGVQEPITIEQK